MLSRNMQHPHFRYCIVTTTSILLMEMLQVKNCATNTKKEQKKTKGKICTIIFSINNSFKINGMTKIFGLTEAISRFTVGTSLRYPMATHDGSTMRQEFEMAGEI